MVTSTLLPRAIHSIYIVWIVIYSNYALNILIIWDFLNSTLIFDDHKLVFGKMGKKKAWSISVYYWWMYESSSCWKKVSLFTLSKYVFWDASVHFCAFTSLREMQQRCISVEHGKLAVHVWHLQSLKAMGGSHLLIWSWNMICCLVNTLLIRAWCYSIMVLTPAQRFAIDTYLYTYWFSSLMELDLNL